MEPSCRLSLRLPDAVGFLSRDEVRLPEIFESLLKRTSSLLSPHGSTILRSQNEKGRRGCLPPQGVQC
jgi:hypothetical protein